MGLRASSRTRIWPLPFLLGASLPCAEFPFSAMRRLPPFQQTPSSFPLLPLLELRPGYGVTGIGNRLHVSRAHWLFYKVPPHGATWLSLGKSGTQGLLKLRAPPAVSMGQCSRQFRAPFLRRQRMKIPGKWQGRKGMQSKQIRVIGKKASHGRKGLGGNRRKVGSSSSSPVPP